MKPMTPDEIQTAATIVRIELQQRTCCPAHTADVLVLVMAGFCLDDAKQNTAVAARYLEAAAARVASDLRRGRYELRRKQ